MNNDKNSTDKNDNILLNEAGDIRSSDAVNPANETIVETTGNAEETNAVEDDIKVLEGGHQKTPGSSGAFPVGAFDTSKE